MSANTEFKLNETEEKIIKTIRELKYGAVEVIVHDSKIVQVEKNEKIRFDKKGE
jgi:hypothetical protein